MHTKWFCAILVVGLVTGGSLMPAAPGRAQVTDEAVRSGSGQVEEHDEDVVRLTPERMRMAGIEVAPVGEMEFGRRITATGEVELNADRTAHVGPRIPGRVVEVRGFLGDRVSTGQPLLILDSVELGRAKAEFRKARARVELSKRNHEREKRLFEEKVSSEREMLEAQTAYEEARIRYEAAEETLHILGMSQQEIDRIEKAHEAWGATLLPVPAPFAGTIVEKHATLGEIVDPSSVLYTISDLSTVWVEAHIYEKDLRFVHKGSSAKVTVAAYPDETFEGKITYISDLLDEATRTIRARVEVSNLDRELRPGMFADVQIVSGEKTRVLAIPELAVQSDGERWIVYVTDDGQSFRERKVQVGERLDGYVAVLAGLQTGERIAVKGSFFIKSEAAKEGFEAGHGH